MTETARMPKMVVVGRIRPKDLGNPKVPAAWDESDERKHVLGTIIGKATGVKKILMDPKDETSIAWALTGFFEGHPANNGSDSLPLPENDPKRKPIMRSGVLWLPGGLHEMVVSAVAGDDPSDKRAVKNIVPIKCEIATRHATNRVGYEYVNDFDMDIQATDPLADLREPIALLEHDPETGEVGGDAGGADDGEGEGTTRRRRRK